MMKAASVSSVHESALSAGKIAAEELLAALGGQPDVALAFVSARYDQAKVVEGLYERLDARARLVGCSSYAEINDEEGLSGSVALMGIRTGGVQHASFLVRDLAGREREGGRELGAGARAFGPSLLILLADGLVNTDQLLLGMQDELGPTFPIVGGMSIDEAKFERTTQIRDREVISGGAVALGLKGQVELLSGARSGWTPIGAARRCTRVEGGNVVLELDGRPALSLYKDYLGPRAEEMPGVSIEYPIGIVGGLAGTQRLDDDEAILLLRSVKGVDEARQALIFGGDIPEGAEVRMTRGTRAEVIRGASELGERLCAAMPDPSLALFFNCGGRKMVLGSRYTEELRDTFSRLRGVPKIGFYSAGEFSPVGGVTMHHDETFTMALIKG
jgi:hypothetical protein